MHGCLGEHPSVALAREVGLGHLPKKLAEEDGAEVVRSRVAKCISWTIREPMGLHAEVDGWMGFEVPKIYNIHPPSFPLPIPPSQMKHSRESVVSMRRKSMWSLLVAFLLSLFCDCFRCL